MKHLGDICKINGAEIEIVDVITGGSPCQDLSIAGKRAGLAGARSGLFMEQVRIVKEMRERDRANGRTGDMVRPRFMVWENVPGAFSSNKGKDFAAVLEEIIRIAEPEAPDIDVPEKGWPTWGGYHDEVGGRWSVAWRVHDAQHWGVPQRRRRISVVADFGGDTAGEILFERKSVSRHPTESGTAGERLAGNAENGAGRTGESIAYVYGETGVGYWQNGAQTLRAEGENRPSRPSNVVICMATQQGGAELRSDDRAPTLTAAEGMSGNNQPVVCAGFEATPINLMVATRCKALGRGTGFGVGEPGDPANTISASHSHGVFATAIGNQVPLAYGIGNGQACEASIMAEEIAQTLNTMHDAQAVMCEDVSHALRAKANCAYREDAETYPVQNMVVRRLTPMECERLQGFPDGWTDIGEWRDSKGKMRKPSDSPRYKALGNSIALPFWDFLAKRISAQYLRPVTMGSLFDGIGGFPLVFERHNGKGTARWASEIEEFPIAVTKLRFGED